MRTWNLQYGHWPRHSVLDMVNAFIKVNGVDVPYSIKSRRAGDIATCYCNPKAGAELGWEAQYGIERCVEIVGIGRRITPMATDDIMRLVNLIL